MVYIHSLPLDDFTPPTPQEHIQNTVLVYPNPASKNLHVLSMHGAHKPLLARLYDMSGKIVLEKTTDQDSFTLNISSLLPGVYVFKLYNGYEININTGKIIVR
jgi:hypothetical protein